MFTNELASAAQELTANYRLNPLLRLLCCRYLRRSATRRMAAYHVGTRRRHVFMFLAAASNFDLQFAQKCSYTFWAIYWKVCHHSHVINRKSVPKYLTSEVLMVLQYDTQYRSLSKIPDTLFTCFSLCSSRSVWRWQQQQYRVHRYRMRLRLCCLQLCLEQTQS